MERLKHGSWVLLAVIGLINLVRGLAHVLTADSAAGQAGISIDHAGRDDIIYLFAIIGGVQVILALFYLYVALFNQPVVLIALVIEVAKTTLNLFIGFSFKPSNAEPVVGSAQDSIQLILSLVGLGVIAMVHLQNRKQYG